MRMSTYIRLHSLRIRLWRMIKIGILTESGVDQLNNRSSIPGVFLDPLAGLITRDLDSLPNLDWFRSKIEEIRPLV
jgi:hypothetical protein